MSRRINCSRCGADLIGHAKFCVTCANDFEQSPLEKAAPDLLEACEDVKLELELLLGFAKIEPDKILQSRKVSSVKARIKQIETAIAKAKKE